MDRKRFIEGGPDVVFSTLAPGVVKQHWDMIARAAAPHRIC